VNLVLFSGIPGSGKSTFYKEIFYDTHVRVNLDMLKTRNREEKQIDRNILKQPENVDSKLKVISLYL
jgi:tRNA uridine 5-carbamoylmethylation protein Kti12